MGLFTDGSWPPGCSKINECPRWGRSNLVADALFLSLWFPSFDLDEMMPRALAVMRQFPFSAVQPGITYVAMHPVSWGEPTIFEQRLRPGIPPEDAVLLASDLLHEDYAYLFEAFWDLCGFFRPARVDSAAIAREIPGPRRGL